MRLELHVLRKVAKLPQGQKVPVGALARELNSTQAVVIDALEQLVADEKLDRHTLRPPVPSTTRPDVEAHECGGCAPPVYTFAPSPKKEPLSFDEQLARVERGEVGIAPVLRIPTPYREQTLGGVAPEAL